MTIEHRARTAEHHLIYLARPIDMGRVKPELVDYAIGELAAMAYTSYDPLGAFNVAGRPTGVINKVNEAAMTYSTGALAFLPAGVPTVGVPAEISYLNTTGKPVAIFSDNDDSWVVAGWRKGANTEVFPLDETGVSAGIDWLNSELARRDVVPYFEPDLITFEKKHEAATLPTRGYETDAGYDLYSCDDVFVPARGAALVPIGIAVDVPDGLWAQITGRSSTLKDLGLMVAPTVGVIDEGYTGELFAPVVSISDKPVYISSGQRVAQLILHEAAGQGYRPAWGVTRTKDRGANGFGSTGR